MTDTPKGSDPAFPVPRISLAKTEFGYNRTTYTGTCSEDVTDADIKARFCDSYFGGAAYIKDGKFTCVAFGSD